MKKFANCMLLLSAAIYYLACTADCIFREPDLQKFTNLVSSKKYQDSLNNNIITAGMPYFVLKDISRNCSVEQILVASIGSKQELLESEGLGRVYHDPSIKVFLNICNTSKGILNVWYGNMTFYSLEVRKNDLIIFYNNETTDTAKILYLVNPGKLRINKDLNLSLVQYSEIIHKEQEGKISYWYNLTAADSNVVINLKGLDYYPIYRMELDNKEVKSFRFK